MIKKITIILLNVIIFLSVQAQSGSEVYRFLSLPSSSHVAALGGTNVSLYSNDLNFAMHNPGLLNIDMHNQLAINVTNYLADIVFGSAAYSHKINDKNFLAATVLFVDYGDFTERDQNGEEYGDFSATDVALHLMYSRRLSEYWMLGATLKPVFSSYEKYSSFGLGVDVGITYNNKERFFTAGLVAKNIGRQLTGYYKDDGKQHIEAFPFEIQAGLTKKLKNAPFRFSITAHDLQRWDMSYNNNLKTTSINGVTETVDNKLNFGENLMRHLIFNVELVPSDKFYLAIGYNYQRNRELKVLDNKSVNGFSFGAGLKLYKFNLGFSTARYHMSNSSYHFSISTDLSSFNL